MKRREESKQEDSALRAVDTKLTLPAAGRVLGLWVLLGCPIDGLLYPLLHSRFCEQVRTVAGGMVRRVMRSVVRNHFLEHQLTRDLRQQ